MISHHPPVRLAHNQLIVIPWCEQPWHAAILDGVKSHDEILISFVLIVVGIVW
jgi:hypothetical protein